MRVGRWDAEQDLYQILEVSPRAGTDEIRRAHRRLVKLYHPDRRHTASSEVRMKRVNHAASVLLDPAARASYDRLRSGARPEPRPAPPPPPAWYDAPPSPPSREAVPQSPSWWDRLVQRSMMPRSAAPIPSVVLAMALIFPVLVALLVPLLGGPVPVSSPDYRIPPPPQRVTMWAP